MIALLLASLLMSQGERVPVLVELFTSESCLDAPEADRLLARLDQDQPFEGADLVVLSEHVDYYNALGWTDPFSRPLFLARQRDYAQLLAGSLVVPRSVLNGTRSKPLDRAPNETQVYAPEVVVDGVAGFAGSDMDDAKHAVQEALKSEKAPISVDVQLRHGKTVISIHMDRSPGGTLYLALAYDAVKSHVRAGPNEGVDFSHIAVVYSLQELGVGQRGDGYDREIATKVQPGSRIVAFVVGTQAATVQDAVTLSARVLHKPVSRAGVGRVIAIGQARF